MKKIIITIFALTVGLNLLAQNKLSESNTQQFILIIRSKADLSKFSPAVIQSNIKHWQEYMGSLAQSGKIAGGYRPGNTGETITKDKNVKTRIYAARNEVVSSFLIINAADIKEANTIALNCPVFELGGSIEIRPLLNVAS